LPDPSDGIGDQTRPTGRLGPLRIIEVAHPRYLRLRGHSPVPAHVSRNAREHVSIPPIAAVGAEHVAPIRVVVRVQPIGLVDDGPVPAIVLQDGEDGRIPARRGHVRLDEIGDHLIVADSVHDSYRTPRGSVVSLHNAYSVPSKEEYDRHAEIARTLSQARRTLHLRRCRYIGLQKAHLQHLLTAAAVNVIRVGLWLDDTPRARIRWSPFVALMHPAA